MSVRIRATAAAFILVSLAAQTPVLAQGLNQQLSAEEQVAAQNFNGIDIVGDSLPTNTNGNGQNFSHSMGAGGNQNAFSNSMMQNGLSTQLNNQNTQLGQVNAGGMSNMNSMNSMNSNGMNNMSNGMNSMGMNNVNGCNGMNAGNNNFNSGNNGMMQNEFAGNGMAANNGGIAQTIGNTIMNDPKLMQQAVGVAGAAALFGFFVSNGGVGGLMRSAGLDNTRHIRGPGGGY